MSGVMVGMYYRKISFIMGWNYGLKAFTATILGGIGNIPGAMLGGLLLGSIGKCWVPLTFPLLIRMCLYF